MGLNWRGGSRDGGSVDGDIGHYVLYSPYTQLCDRREELVWAVLQRRRPKFLVERLALNLVRKIRAVAETRTGPEREAG